MNLCVVDSSVAIKWYLPEIHALEAGQLRSSNVTFHVPDFFQVEIASILWKKIRSGVLSSEDAVDILSDLSGKTAMTYHATLPLVPHAFELANQTGRTVYDCLYLALALKLGGVFVTADEKLTNALANTSWSGSVRKLSDVVAP